MPSILKKKPLQALRATFAAVRPNAPAPSGAEAIDWVVSHQSPFPWLNTVMFLPATTPARGDERA